MVTHVNDGQALVHYLPVYTVASCGFTNGNIFPDFLSDDVSR